MSKAGRHTRKWHIERYISENGEHPEEIIRDLFIAGEPLTVIAGIIGMSYGSAHRWVRDLGLERPRPRPNNPHPVKDRIRRELGFDAVSLICADRASGMKLRELCKKYNVSNGFINRCLHAGAPHLVGTPDEPIEVAPREISAETRSQQAERCREHNRIMRVYKRGWFNW